MSSEFHTNEIIQNMFLASVAQFYVCKLTHVLTICSSHCCVLFHWMSTDTPCFTVLQLLDINSLWNPVSSKSKGATFPLHVCLILVSLKIFQFFYYFYIWYGDLWSVIFDIMVVIFGRGGGHHKPCPYEMVNLTSKRFVCSDWSVDQTFPQLSPSPGAFSFPEIQQH